MSRSRRSGKAVQLKRLRYGLLSEPDFSQRSILEFLIPTKREEINHYEDFEFQFSPPYTSEIEHFTSELGQESLLAALNRDNSLGNLTVGSKAAIFEQSSLSKPDEPPSLELEYDSDASSQASTVVLEHKFIKVLPRIISNEVVFFRFKLVPQPLLITID